MSNAQHVQPINVMSTKAHLVDEQVHRSVFRDVAEILYDRLTEPQRTFFLSLFPKPTQWFADHDMRAWSIILEQLGFVGNQDIVRDCANTRDVTADYSILNNFLHEIGARDLNIST